MGRLQATAFLAGNGSLCSDAVEHDSTRARIAALEAEIAFLKAKLLPPPKIDEAFVKHYQPPPRQNWRQFCPMFDEYALRMLQLGEREYLRRIRDLAHTPLEQLIEPLQITVTVIITYFRRLERPDNRRLVGEFCDDGERAASSLGAPSRYVNELFFFAAGPVLGAPFTLWDPNRGHIATLGVSANNIGAHFRFEERTSLCKPANFEFIREPPTHSPDDYYGQRSVRIWQGGFAR